MPERAALMEVPRIEMADVLAKSDVHLASNQVEFNLLRQLPETSGMLAEMRKRDITLLACRSTVLPHLPTVDGKSDSPLAMGRLTGKYSASNPVPKKRRYVFYRVDEATKVAQVQQPVYP